MHVLLRADVSPSQAWAPAQVGVQAKPGPKPRLVPSLAWAQWPRLGPTSGKPAQAICQRRHANCFGHTWMSLWVEIQTHISVSRAMFSLPQFVFTNVSSSVVFSSSVVLQQRAIWPTPDTHNGDQGRPPLKGPPLSTFLI